MYQRLSDLQQTDALITLRTFNLGGYFTSGVYEIVDERQKCWWNFELCRIMMDFQLDVVGIALLAAIAIGAVTTGVDAGATGMALMFAERFSSVVARLIKRLVHVENGISSVERMSEYANLPSEWTTHREVAQEWPQHGDLEVCELTASYESEFEKPVLQDLSFSGSPGQRIGIVGRTGAGKSSFTLALTRHMHTRGQILIDGVDLSTMNLKHLRRSLFIISQDPYLFEGTLRHAVDPAAAHTDEEVHSVLSAVRFTATAKDDTLKTIDLSFHITQGGLNLSQGQRQMIRLAQALLARRKLVIMDEATSAIDADADAAIQKALRGRLNGSTVLVIAHRLATVADFDKVLVLEDGRLVESGPPGELYGRKGAFWRLVGSSADKDELVKIFEARAGNVGI